MTSPTFSEEFKREAVALVRKGVGVQQAADQFGVPNEMLRQWIRDPELQAPDTEPVDAATYQTALERIAKLEQENEMLLKISVFFARKMTT